MSDSLIVGIGGGSASGKTHFLNSLLSHFTEEEVCLISQDNYYRESSQVPKDKNGIFNFDLPESIDFRRFEDHIQRLKNGEQVTLKEYTFEGAFEAKTITLNPAPIIVVEGIFAFFDPEISKMQDLKIFIDASEYVKIRRRIVRDTSERAYDLQSILYRWENHVAPSYERFILPTKKEANIVINNNSDFDIGLRILTVYLKDFLKTRVKTF